MDENSVWLTSQDVGPGIPDVSLAMREGYSTANEEARARIGDLAAERDSLTNQVAALKKTVADYRTRFEALLQAQQEAMDKINDL